MYAKLENEQDTPIFKVTPGKNCRMYPYLWTQECEDFFSGKSGIDPKTNPFNCRAQGPVDPASQYTGYPISFSYNLSGNPKNAEKPVDSYPNIIGQASSDKEVKENFSPCLVRQALTVPRCRKCPNSCKSDGCGWKCN